MAYFLFGSDIMNNINYKAFVTTAIFGVIFIVIGLYNLPLSHFLAGIYTVYIGLMIFVIAINSRFSMVKSILLAFGIAYLYIGVLDFFHIITHEGIHLIDVIDTASTDSWIYARVLEALCFFAVLLYFKFQLKLKYLLSHIVLFILLVGFLVLSVTTPLTMISNQIYIYIEIVVILLFIAASIFIKGSEFTSKQKGILYHVIVFKVISEILIVGLYDFHSLFIQFGIFFRVLSYGGLYAVFVYSSISEPYSNISKFITSRHSQLLKLSEIDQLTGLYNHSVTFQKIEEFIDKNTPTKSTIFISMIDIDDFKLVNDKHGHQIGDSVLKTFGTILSEYQLDDKIVGRYGGDEFLICGIVDNPDQFSFDYFNSRMHIIDDTTGVSVTYSAGTVFYETGDTLRDLIYKADIKMYESKRLGKNRVSIWKNG
jgi:diguanylate cyclase (GGDEF)-like protein